MADRERGKLLTAISEIGIGTEDKSTRPSAYAFQR